MTAEAIRDEPDRLVADVGRLVDACARSPQRGDGELQAELDQLAARTVELQLERIAAYRRLWCAGGLDRARDEKARPGAWRRTPPVPVAAFKEPGLELWTAPPRLVFRSSGTTVGRHRRSEHHHPYPDLYRRIVDASFPAACLERALLDGADRAPMLSLIPPLAEVPDSSLGFMIDHVLARWGARGSRSVLGAGGLDARSAHAFLSEHARGGRPVLVVATALALAGLLEALRERPLERRLPPGSVVFETGGFKGRERDMTRSELVAHTGEQLGIPPERIVREYGMTELTSQAYTRALGGGDPDVFFAPPWLLWRLLDPHTGAEVAPGAPGLLCFFDLGNVGSISHLLTEDVGRAAGEGGFELLGRASDAELRGCSLTAEALLR